MTQLPLEWCKEHISDLANMASVLYQKYISGENFAVYKNYNPPCR
jgi:hypothetical protein